MSKITLQVKDTSTLCPVPGSYKGVQFPLPVGTKVKNNLSEKTFTVTGSTAHMAFFKGQGHFLPEGTASKVKPASIELEITLPGEE